jgi:hypothetical protein
LADAATGPILAAINSRQHDYEVQCVGGCG